jgi:hypothetical protein
MNENGFSKYFLQAVEYCKVIKFDTKWVLKISPDTITPSCFFKEYVWVVYASNFKVNILEKYRINLYQAYGDYRTLDITRKDAVLSVINNLSKWNAVLDTAKKLKYIGWKGEFGFKEIYLSSIDSMTVFKFIKDITKFHLARNLGFDVAKPDRWMQRIRDQFECLSVKEMCQYLSSKYNMPVKQIDLILWKYASDQGF